MMNIKNVTQVLRNVWLIELLEANPDGMTIEEILNEYNYRPPQLGNNVNPSQVSERTIHNWMKEIKEIFNVKIVCGRGKKTYNIENDDYLDNPFVNIARHLTEEFNKLVALDYRKQKKSGKTKYGELYAGFMQMGNSMLNGESVAIRYGKKHHTIGFNEPCIFKPFFIKVIDNECYVIGETRPVSGLWGERIEVYSLDRLSMFEKGEFPIENYTIPTNLTPMDYYGDGTFVIRRYANKKLANKTVPPLAVFFNAHNDTADYLREHPIAPTQTEIESIRTNNTNIFMVVVKPDEDFYTKMFSFGEELTIIDPDFLKRDSDGNKKVFGYKRYDEDLIGYDYFSLNNINVMKRRGIGVNMLLQNKYGGLTDAQLVAKYQQGEEFGFEILYKKYSKNILLYLQNLANDKFYADHLNSITWEKVSVALLKGQYQASEPFENWLKVIAKNTFLNWCKEQKRVLPPASFDYDDSVFQGVDEGPERALEKKENRKVLESLIADLPPELRRVLELDQKGYAFVDIAKIEGVPKDIIERRYRSAVRAIQDMLF